MPRVFEVYPTRRKISLEGVWKLAIFDKPRKTPPPADSYTRQISVPGVWECLYELSHHRGFGWFRKEFFVAEETARDAGLVFEAVSHTARVWLDGRYLGEHYGAHTAFSFPLKNLEPGTHVLEVEVDNRFGPCNPLTDSYQDIYTYGGIVRPVMIHLLPSTHLAEASAMPVWTKGGWSLDVQGRVAGAASIKTVKFQLSDAQPVDLPVRKNGNFSARIPAGSIREWSPEDPALHTVSLTAGEDVWVERVGFRKVEVKGKQILLNGKPLNMVGVNRHEFHPDFGLAVPQAIHHRDIEILKDMGANFVRGSHYPNDPFFLDLCDENGILFWEELAHWQPRSQELKDPAFLQASLTQLEEMVTQHRHHPCIILWGMLNELDSDLPEARPVVGKLAKAFKALDPTRPVTYATRKPDEDICFDLVDVLSLNLYPGWYWCGLEETPEAAKSLIRTMRKRGGNKPLIFSEFGGGAMDGIRSFENRKWTENYQSELLRAIIETALAGREVCGLAIWQYCDVRTSDGMGLSRIREYNNKGILTEYRQPKLAYWTVRDLYRSAGKSPKARS